MLTMVIIMNVLIVGATSGLGFEVGCELLRKGHFVYFTTHSQGQIQTLRKKLEEKNYVDGYKCFRLDITSASDRKKIKKLSIDCLFCNGAMGLGGTLFDLSIDDIRENFEVNVFSNLTLVKFFLEECLREKKYKKVVITTSIAGLMPVPLMDSYSATKAALISFATTLYYEQRIFSLPYSIKIIEPGIYQTGFNEFMLLTAEDNSFFKIDKFRNFELRLFKWISKRNYYSITRRMVRAIESSSKKFVYRAPFSQVIFLKLYLFFFK